MIEMHGALRPALTHRPQRVDIAEHVGERHHRLDDASIIARIHASDLAAPTVKIADHIAHVVVWRYHLDPHDRFENPWRRLHYPILERRPRGNLEGEHARINFMI